MLPWDISECEMNKKEKNKKKSKKKDFVVK